jgi:hypothetical protein
MVRGWYRGCGAGVVCAALVVGWGVRAQAAQVLYLNFSDGTEDIVQGEADNAARNESMMGSATPYPAFQWPGVDGAEARAALVQDVTRQVHEAFLPYDILVTTTRPAAGPYTMVMIGGNPSLFRMEPRVAGVAFMDCDDRQAANIVYAFPEPLGSNVHGLFTTIAQEAAHALGLQHSSDPNDLMYPRVDLAQRNFQDRASTVASPRYCSDQTQNSHRRLLDLLGAWAGPDKPMGGPVIADSLGAGDEVDARAPTGGCTVAGSGAQRANPGLWLAALTLFALRACRRRSGGL